MTYIVREALLEQIDELIERALPDSGEMLNLLKVYRLVCKMPATNLRKSKGVARWKSEGFGDYRCSRCGIVVSGGNAEECPCCGAEMAED